MPAGKMIYLSKYIFRREALIGRGSILSDGKTGYDVRALDTGNRAPLLFFLRSDGEIRAVKRHGENNTVDRLSGTRYSVFGFNPGNRPPRGILA